MNTLERAKYRGKRVDGGEWVYGSLIQLNNQCYIEESKNGDLHDIDYGMGLTQVHPKTVGQLTGLTDKNGVDIYEGDICSFIDCWDTSTESGYDFQEYSNQGEIHFCNEFFGWDITKREQDREDVFIPSEMAVIGNIHDNPELLEVVK